VKVYKKNSYIQRGKLIWVRIPMYFGFCIITQKERNENKTWSEIVESIAGN
jgi:hypothetical protein